LRKTTTLSVLAAAVLALVLGAAFADNKPTVTITKPLAAAVVSGTQVEVEVVYRSNSGEKIVKAEVYVDRQFRFGGDIEPTLSGASRFLWDTTLYSEGPHSIEAAALDAAGNAGSVAVSVKTVNPSLPVSGSPFAVAIVTPAEGQELKGTVDVLVKAQKDEDVRWISYFIDGEFWAARNFPPFSERWDTAEYADGQHLLSVSAFGPQQEKATASVTVYVNNTGSALATAPEEVQSQPSEEVVEMAPLGTVESAAFASPATEEQGSGVSFLEGIALDTGLLASEGYALADAFPANSPSPEALVMLPSAPETTSLPAETMASGPDLGPLGAAAGEASASSNPSESAEAVVLMPGPTSSPAALSEAPVVPAPEAPPETAVPSATPLTVSPEVPSGVEYSVPSETDLTLAALLSLGSASDLRTAPTQPASVATTLPQLPPGTELSVPGETNLTVLPATQTPGQPAEAATGSLVMLPSHSTAEEIAPVAESVSRPALPTNPPSIPNLPIVYYDGEAIVFPDVPAHIYKGMSLVPVRFLIEQKGGTVKWLDKEQQVIAVTWDGNKTIQLQIGSREILVNGEKKTMPIRAYLLPPGRTIVPLRFFSQMLDADVAYDSSTGNLFLSSLASGTQPTTESLTSR